MSDDVPAVLRMTASREEQDAARARHDYGRQCIRWMYEHRKGREYRRGAIQLAVYVGLVSQDEWRRLHAGEDASEVLR